MSKYPRAIAIGLVSAIVCFNASTALQAGEGFFQKIGDGWKHGKWIRGMPDIKPQTWQEVVFPRRGERSSEAVVLTVASLFFGRN